MHFPKGLTRRVHRAAAWLAFFSLTLTAWPGVALAANSGAPSWVGRGAVEAHEGFATLRWRAPKGSVADFFRLVERRDEGEHAVYLEGDRVTLYRTAPGRYRFYLQACERDTRDLPVCGPSSSPLTLVVDGEWKQEAAAKTAGATGEPTGPAVPDTVPGGPDRLRPGLWFNPERSGHGYSFFWANRLALPESHASHGLAYDLLGLWYTYEARTLSYDCSSWSTSGCVQRYSDYRPLAARLRLVQDGTSRFSGGIFVTRNGQEVLEGSASIEFGATNTRATITWEVDFKYERHAATEELTFLAGSDPVERVNATHYAGIWQPADGSGLQWVDNVGSYSEAVEWIFEDTNGDPGWIQAVNEGVASSAATSLCFYYAKSGYAPDGTGDILYHDSGCASGAQATAANRNGRRTFTGFETMQAWARFTLPDGLGEVRLGSASAPADLTKAASFHRIRFETPAGGCVLSTATPACEVAVTWFTDGDYPRATAFLHDVDTGARSTLGSPGSVAVVDHRVALEQPGAFRFELRMGDTPTSTLIARSAVLEVSRDTLAPPAGLAASWQDEGARTLRLEWSHPDATGVDRFQVEESAPGADGVEIHEVSGTQPFIVLDRSAGPWGQFAYRVRACVDGPSGPDCSAWAGPVYWAVDEPSASGAAVTHPWGDNAEGSGSLIVNLAMHYAMGYHFRPETAGHVTELGGYFNGVKTVRLFDRATRNLLAEAHVSADNRWRYAPIEPVPVEAGREYTVAVYLENSGGSYYGSPALPATHGDVTVLGSTYVSTASNPDAVPTNRILRPMYGQADIGFVATPPPDDGDPAVPANPETPPEPAAKPDFSIDPASTAVGATRGAFDVDPHGAATYRIPLPVAPGSGGLAPDLSLQYVSQAPNDIAGVGWSIGGLSSVSRCPQTIEQDGTPLNRGVGLDAGDRFCLDGKRLVVVAGSYGGDGAEYRTEVDGFARIRSFGRAGDGPAWFRVWHGDGSFSDYGATPDSRIEARGAANPSTVLSWAVNRREDAAGNYIEYVYRENAQGPVEAVLERVRYTGNRRAGTQPYAELRFSYATGRGDIPLTHVAGVAVARERLLERVDSLAKVRGADSSMASLRSFFLAYGQDGFGRRVLESVTECSDTTQRYCFPPTTFDWLKGENGIGGTGGTPVGDLFPRNFRGLDIADVNGDGRNDLLIVEGRKQFSLSVAFAERDGGFRKGGSGYAIPDAGDGGEPVRLLVIDIDADGRQDVLYPRHGADGVDWVARLGSAAGFGPERVVSAACCGLQQPRVASVVDFNGDGLADLLTNRSDGARADQGDLVILLNTSRSAGQPRFEAPRPVLVAYDESLFPQDPASGWYLVDDTPGFSEVAVRSPTALQAFDYNGDGAVDLLARIDRRYVLCDTRCDTTLSAAQASADGQLLDFDGAGTAAGEDTVTVAFYVVFESDGLDRYVQRHVVATDAESGCDVPVACTPWAHLPAAHQLQSVDVNGDGLADLAWRDNRQDWWYRLNTAKGFGAARLVVRLSDRERSEQGRFSDLTGDGYPEFVVPSALDHPDATWLVHANDLGAGFGAAESSAIRIGNHGGGDVSLLYDFNGDGATDNLLLDFRYGVVDGNASALYPGRNRLTGRTHEAANVIAEVRDGAGVVTRIAYQSMSDPMTYTRLDDAADAEWGRGSPVFDLLAPLWLVGSVEHSAPTATNANAFNTTLYRYAGARAQAGGRGFLGFAEVVRWSPREGMRTNTRYRQDFPFTGRVADVSRSRVSAANGLDLLGAPLRWPALNGNTPPPSAGAGLLDHNAYGWSSESTSARSRHVRESARLARNWSPRGELLKKSLTTYEHDGHGRITRAAEHTWDAENGEARLGVETRNTYLTPESSRWMLHRLSAVTVTHSRPGAADVTRSTAFAWDSATGRRVRETTEPGDSALEVVTEHGLDAFGNVVETTVRARDVPPRVSRVAFDPLGRFAVRETNPFGQVTMRVDDWNAAGTPLAVSDIDGVMTYSAADPMGRVFINWSETGSWDRTVRRTGRGAVCPPGTAGYLFTRSGGRPDRYDCLDILGRTVRSAKQGFDGRLVFEDTGYDAAGRAVRVSEPYFQGDTRYWNVMSYDGIGRVTEIDSAAGDDVRQSYGADAPAHCGVTDPHAVHSVNSLGQQRVEIRNALGETVAVVDSLCGRVDYRYDAIGNLVEAAGADGATVRMSYDRAGRRTEMLDPDKGRWRYAWNGLGELTRQLDSKGQALDYRYDALGRVIERRELTGVGSLHDAVVTVVNSEYTTWQNSSSSNVRGKAQPLTVVYREGAGGVVRHRRDYVYDEFGRQAEVVTAIGERQFTETTTRDAYGRVFQAFDASGDARGIRHVHNDRGYVEVLREAREGADGVEYSRVLAMDARGRVTAWLLGNGVEAFAEYDAASGALTRLEAYDAAGRELQETGFLFDTLGNLVQRADRSNGRDQVERFDYDELNRLVEVRHEAPGALMPPDTLRIAYDAAGNITRKSDVGEYRYGDGPAGPHAVTQVGGYIYAYDANGNQVSGAGRTLEYSVFDKVTRVTRTGMETRFEYGIAHQRIRRIDRNDVDGDKTTWYLDTVDYIETTTSSHFRRRIADAAVVDFHPATDASSTRYAVRDHLGSIHNLTDETGSLQSATWMGFDAFGQRRAADWSGSLGTGALAMLNAMTSKGFTGHEHVDAMGLIDMKGRIYDPRLGRFLQADPLVQQPSNGQGLNRYSYAANNPLSYTDPSGYFLKRFLKRWGRLVAAVALSVVLPGGGGVLATTFGIGNVYAQAAITGFVAGAVASGTFKGAVIGSLVSLAVAGVVEAYNAATRAEGLASADELMPPEHEVKRLYGNNEPTSGLYRIQVSKNGIYLGSAQISPSQIVDGDSIFSNGIMNGFRDAVRNGTVHLHQAGLLGDNFVLNFNPTHGFFADLAEASRDIIGAHTGLAQSALARDLAQVLHEASIRGVTQLQIVGHSQGGAITASALRYANKVGLSLRSLSGGGVSLHGAPVNAWMARNRLIDRGLSNIVSRAQFGDAVHVLGGLNVSNPLEVLISVYRTPALFSSDVSVSPHSLPCGGSTSLVCAY